MAFIYNIKNKVLTECQNTDVIKLCKKDPIHYVVEDKKETAEKSIANLNISTEASKVPLSRMKLDDLKATASQLGLECEGLNCEELRKIIRDAQR